VQFRDTVILMSGYRNPKLMAVRLGRTGDLTGTDAIVWETARGAGPSSRHGSRSETICVCEASRTCSASAKGAERNAPLPRDGHLHDRAETARHSGLVGQREFPGLTRRFAWLVRRAAPSHLLLLSGFRVPPVLGLPIGLALLLPDTIFLTHVSLHTRTARFWGVTPDLRAAVACRVVSGLRGAKGAPFTIR
jgi:hypothetical protein